MATPTQPPRLHLIRSAQANHNTSLANHQIRDPLLTPTGGLQARHLRHAIPPSIRDRIGFFAASPLRRTLYTALLAFEDLLLPEGREEGLMSTGIGTDPLPIPESGLSVSHNTPRFPVFAVAEAQTVSDRPCDTGSHRDQLVAVFNVVDGPWIYLVSMAHLRKDWFIKKSKWATDEAMVKARAAAVRRWCRKKLAGLEGEKRDMVLVTHGTFLHYLTQDWSGYEEVAETGWENSEVRSFQFVDGLRTDDDDAKIEETEESKQYREKNGPMCGLDGSLETEELAPARDAIAFEH
ncbi:hypothetical protein P152DRAFT_478285 [Eremomyces bilateralis CBS 781.70]|uniref:Phosphoglycerate mutase-like protein n=1 Tax=Eremomyces bilateralis CBS 781.70 TaxID=1392243 RepID=A0A6G1GH54_9PEZI|nr:uncharacterized protein P152DRAFT_478285 [Eremomyces bilateralis CBS 781.70]KAF1817266.1 hypothetical protein P152DRAFT_478285 [Eremomyces bilateralis CBS 781.70]